MPRFNLLNFIYGGNSTMEEKANMKLSTQRILEVASNMIKPCIRYQQDYIIFPNDFGLLGTMLRPNVSTDEQPQQQTDYHLAMRIIDGRVLMTGGKPDIQELSHKRFAIWEHYNMLSLIGTNSAEAVINLTETITRITNNAEKYLFVDMLCNLKKDLLLHTISKESLFCIEITPELYNSGITNCVEWFRPTNENGEVDITQLNIGDYLIVSDDPQYSKGPADWSRVECIRHNEFILTHYLKE